MPETMPRIEDAQDEFHPEPVATRTMDRLETVADRMGGPYQPPDGTEGAVAFTHFDAPSSEDNTVIVLLAKQNMEKLPSQSIVRIRSLGDAKEGLSARDYLAIVVAGPFAEPDGLRVDSSIVVATTVQGTVFLPRYHGRAFLQLLGEEVNGQLVPPRLRPRPNSPVFPLSTEETAKVLKAGGEARIGVVVGQESIAVGIPTSLKSVLPRHLGVLGTTGGGKSTTVSRMVHQFQKAGVATILIDIEGEYTEMDLPTTDPVMLTALKLRDMKPEGVGGFGVGHLVGRETSRPPELKKLRIFSLPFDGLSQHVVMEILDLEEAQQVRFLKAYDTTKLLLKDLDIFPKKGEEQRALEIDELEEGYPRMKLSHLLDVVSAFTDWAGITKEEARRSKNKEDNEDDTGWTINPRSPDFVGHESKIKQRVVTAQAPKMPNSWKVIAGKLWRLHRLNVFDNPAAPPPDHGKMLIPGRVSVIDLSDTDSPDLRNLLIADLLRNIQRQQEVNVQSIKEGEKPTPVAIIIEEAHEFLSEQRIKQMPVLFQQVAKIAKRGRKRWLGLVFVTQFPQHLPGEVLGLINNYVLHKIADSTVIDRLKRSISGIDKNLWGLLPGLAPGQALVTLTSMTRPLLVSIDPTPAKLRLVD